jgi:hypothetical protein
LVFFPQYITFSDGGFTENLGAFSLITRGCEDIIIVDAEEDSHYVFDGYRNLKWDILLDLFSPNAVNMEIAEIDDYIGKCQKGKSKEECLKNKPNSKKDNWKYPVMFGKVSDEKKELPPISLTYLKLSFDRENFFGLDTQPTLTECSNEINESQVERFYDNQLIDHAKEDLVFPHYPTVYQHLDRDQREALFRLGQAHMKAAHCLRNERENLLKN